MDLYNEWLNCDDVSLTFANQKLNTVVKNSTSSIRVSNKTGEDIIIETIRATCVVQNKKCVQFNPKSSWEYVIVKSSVDPDQKFGSYLKAGSTLLCYNFTNSLPLQFDLNEGTFGKISLINDSKSAVSGSITYLQKGNEECFILGVNEKICFERDDFEFLVIKNLYDEKTQRAAIFLRGGAEV
ncbi:hypothetical protein HDU92_004057, partial [Lobulomyces angularis]